MGHRIVRKVGIDGPFDQAATGTKARFCGGICSPAQGFPLGNGLCTRLSHRLCTGNDRYSQEGKEEPVWLHGKDPVDLSIQVLCRPMLKKERVGKETAPPRITEAGPLSIKIVDWINPPLQQRVWP